MKSNVILIDNQGNGFDGAKQDRSRADARDLFLCRKGYSHRKEICRYFSGN